jgi:hypothetical protein
MVDVLVPTQAVPSLLGRYMRGWVCHTLTFFSGEVLLLVFDLNDELEPFYFILFYYYIYGTISYLFVAGR